MTVSLLLVILRGIGFTHIKVGGHKLLLGREDITAWCSRFLRQIRKENLDGFVWLDKTCAQVNGVRVNVSHTIVKGWTHDMKEWTITVPGGMGGQNILASRVGWQL